MTTKDYSNVTYQVARRIEDGKTVWINDAKRQRIQPRSLVCLDAECQTPVFARTGNKKRWHFCHYRDEYKKRCKRDVKFSHGESAMHLICKHFLASENSRCCYVDAVCVRCHRQRVMCKYTWNMEAQVEYPISDGKYIIDVALLDKVCKKVVAAVEVFHTHKVDYEKAEYMRQNGIALLEVQTSQIKEVMDKIKQKEGMICLKVVECDEDKHVCDTCMYKDAWYRHVMMVVKRENEYEDEIVKEYNRKKKIEDQLKREALMLEKEKELEEEREELKRFRKQCMAKAVSMMDNARQKLSVLKDPYVRGISFKCEGGCDLWRSKLGGYVPYCEIFGSRRECQGKKGEYYREWDYEEGTGKVCDICFAKCPRCDEPCTLLKLQSYGFCRGCNIHIKEGSF